MSTKLKLDERWRLWQVDIYGEIDYAKVVLGLSEEVVGVLKKHDIRVVYDLADWETKKFLIPDDELNDETRKKLSDVCQSLFNNAYENLHGWSHPRQSAGDFYSTRNISKNNNYIKMDEWFQGICFPNKKSELIDSKFCIKG